MLLVFLSPGDRTYSILKDTLEKKEALKHPFPFCCFPKWKPGVAFLVVTRICVLQFTLLKPFFAVLTIILEMTGNFEEGDFSPHSAYLYITIIENISITVKQKKFQLRQNLKYSSTKKKN